MQIGASGHQVFSRAAEDTAPFSRALAGHASGMTFDQGMTEMRQQGTQATHFIRQPSPEQQRVDLARSITLPGGSGTQEDVDLVVAELARLPLDVLHLLADNGVRVRAARGAVTDYLPELSGQAPSGWPPGFTFDDVPGIYHPPTNEVVVSTIGHGTPEGARVPAFGEGHGSVNLVIHEVFHAVDAHAPVEASSRGAPFQIARTADSAALPPYEEGSESETYAESAARHYSGDTSLSTPALDDFWRNVDFGAE